jgi:anti-sigma factor RsiW
MNKCQDIRDRLGLYLDNELQGEEHQQFEAHLRECEACKTLMDHELEFLNTVRTSPPLYVASPELRERIQNQLLSKQEALAQAQDQLQRRRQSHIRLTWGLLAAAILLVLLLPVLLLHFGGGSKGPNSGGVSSLALMAADAHMRRSRGQLPLEVNTSSPQEISGWFANKVNFSVKLPNYQELSGQEKLYTLEGARLVGFRDDYAAYVAYQMKQRPISLVITADAAAQPFGGEEIKARGLTFHYNAIQGLKVITWSDRGLTYALVSDLEERGQQSCIVCHQGTKDQDFIAPLKPH